MLIYKHTDDYIFFIYGSNKHGGSMTKCAQKLFPMVFFKKCGKKFFFFI